MALLPEDKSNLLTELLSQDTVGKFKQLLREDGMYWIDPKDDMIKAKGLGVSVHQPWVHIFHDKTRPCMLLHHFFNAYKMVPKRCMKCWKIVIQPRTVVELVALYELLEELQYDSKCGIEIRNYVNRNYGGYLYLDTKVGGIERYKEIRAHVDERISREVPVHLKRYCTEFELAKGPTKAYNRPKDADHWEELFWQKFLVQDEHPPQPDYVKRHIIRTWLEFAWDRGDKSVMELNQGVPLYNQADTYHEEK